MPHNYGELSENVLHEDGQLQIILHLFDGNPPANPSYPSEIANDYS